MTIADFINKWANVSTGKFKDNTSRDITEAFMREFTTDITTLTDIPIPLPFWPLGGAADLTSSFDLNFEGFDILIHNDFNEVFYQLDYTGHNFYAINDLSDESQFIVSPGTFQGSTTGPINWFSESDLHFHANDIVNHMHIELDILAGITLQADDGVDASSLSLTPTSLVGSFADGFSLSDVGNGNSIVSDTNGIYTETSGLQVGIRNDTDITHKIYTFLWLDTSINNSAGGSPLNTNNDANIFQNYQDAVCEITIKVLAVKSDGSEGYISEKKYSYRKDGTANPVAIGGEFIVYESGDDVNANSVLSISTSNIRLTITTPANDIYQWTIWAEVNITEV